MMLNFIHNIGYWKVNVNFEKNELRILKQSTLESFDLKLMKGFDFNFQCLLCLYQKFAILKNNSGLDSLKSNCNFTYFFLFRSFAKVKYPLLLIQS